MNEFAIHISGILDHIIASVPVFRPELALIIGFLGSIGVSLFVDQRWRHASLVVTVVSILASAYYLLAQLDQGGSAFFNMLQVDNFSVYARLFILLALLVSIIFIQQHFAHKGAKKPLGDVYSILLAAGMGMHLLTVSTNWLLVFIAIETVSISSYVLVGYFSENKKQSEAAMKYVLFGSSSAAVMLYGLSLFYGFTGNLDFADAAHLQGLMTSPPLLLVIAILFVWVGLGFKLSFVPFHLWTPDVYEGAPTPITAFLSTVPKIAATILFARLYLSWSSTPFYFSEITVLFTTVIAIVTMLIGNLVALRQHNAKRMMAYSSIGHTGFILMAIIGMTDQNQEIFLFYIAVYTLMNLAAFGFIDRLEQLTGSSQLADYSGLGKKHPILFTSFAFIGIALVGLPPTAGFVGKMLVFTSVFELYQYSGDKTVLALLAVGALTSVISLFYYFRIPLYAFLRQENADASTNDRSASWSILTVVAVGFSVLVLVLGLFPHLLLAVISGQ